MQINPEVALPGNIQKAQDGSKLHIHAEQEQQPSLKCSCLLQPAETLCPLQGAERFQIFPGGRLRAWGTNGNDLEYLHRDQ